MPQADDLSRSLVPFQQDATLVAVIEMSQSSWLVAATVPGVDRQPRKKIVPDETALLRLLLRWRDEAIQSGRTIARITVAYEAGRDGFWLARWLIGHGIEAHVIHPTSVAVSREHKRAKTDRLDTAMLIRVFIGWLRGERGHCGMVAVPTIEEEDAKRPSRERENLVVAAALARTHGATSPVPSWALKMILEKPSGPEKFGVILSDMARKLAAIDRYERRAISRRNSAIRTFNSARRRAHAEWSGRQRADLAEQSQIA